MSQPQPPKLLLDRYLPLKQFRGGMGVVHICGDMVERRAVAVKTFLPELMSSPELREAFIREASTWLQVGDHPHVVAARMVRRDDEQVYVVCDLVVPPEEVSSPSLRAWLGRPLPPELALDLALGIVRGMRWATSRVPGLVHRDLKPENVLVGRDRRARVTDFGLAVVGGARGSAAGTPSYMAPEQRRHAELRSDVYAFGLILLEMWTGATGIPRRSTIDATLSAHAAGAPAQHAAAAAMPQPVEDLILACVDRDVAPRPGSWAELEDRLLALWPSVVATPPPTLPPPEAASREMQVQALWSELALGNALDDLGATRDAVAAFTALIGRARALAELEVEGAALNSLGHVLTVRGELAPAQEHLDASLAIRRRLGDRLGESRTIGNLGNLKARRGELEPALADHDRSARISFELGRRSEYLTSRFNALPLLIRVKRADEAIDGARWCREVFREDGKVRGEAMALGTLGQALRLQGSLEEALEASQEALACFRKVADRAGEARELSMQAATLRAMGRPTDAVTPLNLALALAKEIGDRLLIGTTSYALAELMPNMAPLHMVGRDYARQAVEAYRSAGREDLASDAERLHDRLDGSG